jgi:hypothetical protein
MKRVLPGLNAARQKVESQSMDEDLRLIDDLYGRDNLKFGDTPADVKREALAQLERDFTYYDDFAGA